MGWEVALAGLALASSGYGAVQQRKARKEAQKARPVGAAPLATQHDDSAESARRDAQRAARRKKGLQASILAGERSSSGTGAQGGSGGF